MGGEKDMNDYIIELDKVCCKAGYHYLLKDVSWKVRRKEHWVVFGMNGSGKTTLLSIVAGFKFFTSGSVKLFGEPLCNENILAVRKRIGWVSSSFFDRYYSKESALNIVLSGKTGSLGLDESISLKDVHLAKELLTALDLADKIDRPFDLLSKGERQNVLIARALFPNPEILILDEPCAGLDVYHRSYLFSTIEALCRNITIIYVTHYVEEILPLFEKALLLKNGMVYIQGNIDHIFRKDTFENLVGYPLELSKNKENRYQLEIETRSRLYNIIGGR